MVRSFWIGPVVVALAVTGLALSQTVSPTVETKERTITVQEADKPAIKCKLLKTWRQPDGHKAYLAQTLASNEFITIAETSGGEGMAISTKLYHWGVSDHPPEGAPEVPNNALILGYPTGPYPVAKTTTPMLTTTARMDPIKTPATPSKSPVPVSTQTTDVKPLAPLPASTLVAKTPSVASPAPSPATTPVKVTQSPMVPPLPGDDPTLVGPPASLKMPSNTAVVATTTAPNKSAALPLKPGPVAPLPGSIAAAALTPPAPKAGIGPDGTNAFTEPAPPKQENVGQQESQQPSPYQTQIARMPQGSAGMQPIMYQPPPMDRGVSPAMANSFTLASTERPIPANFGPSAQVPNAFADGNTSVVTYTPSMPNNHMMYPSAVMDRGPIPVRTVDVSQPSQREINSPQLMAILRDSLYPSQRESAAEALSLRDWHSHPQIAEALVTAAKDDPAPGVRAECLRSLAHMNVNTPACLKACMALKADTDPRVRKEAELTLVGLTTTGNSTGSMVIRPASMR